LIPLQFTRCEFAANWNVHWGIFWLAVAVRLRKVKVIVVKHFQIAWCLIPACIMKVFLKFRMVDDWSTVWWIIKLKLATTESIANWFQGFIFIAQAIHHII
jgi:hypothetical protein